MIDSPLLDKLVGVVLVNMGTLVSIFGDFDIVARERLDIPWGNIAIFQQDVIRAIA
jgi:hypothetical protein